MAPVGWVALLRLVTRWERTLKFHECIHVVQVTAAVTREGQRAMPLKPPDFDQWFAASAGTDPDGTRFSLHQDRGWLSLPTGRLVAAEPGYFPDADQMAFTQTVPPGRYPVVLLVQECPVRCGPGAGTPGAAIEYVAAARLVIRDEPAAAWEMAVREGQDPSDLDDDGYFGYPVDGGVGCFADAQALQALHADDDGEWLETLALDVADRPAAVSELTDFGEDGQPVLAAFSTGCGDGHYPTWAGRTASGDITCFVTDFLLAGAQPAA
jgi:hypothetical protein